MGTEIDKRRLAMVEEFQCPGCVGGKNTKCGSFQMSDFAHHCIKHCNGTASGLGPISSFALGLPKGFNKAGYVGPDPNAQGARQNRMDIRLWLEGEKMDWDKFNVPVWAMVKDGYLFVRTWAPRINHTSVDVIEKGTLEMVPNAIDVGEFYDDID